MGPKSVAHLTGAEGTTPLTGPIFKVLVNVLETLAAHLLNSGPAIA